MKVVSFIALMLVASSVRAEPAGEFCRRFSPGGMTAVSQTSTRIGNNRSILACVVSHNSGKSIIIVDQNGADAKVIISSRAFNDGTGSSGTRDSGEAPMVSPFVYEQENPVHADPTLLKWNIFSVESYYFTDGEIGLSRLVREMYRFDSKASRLMWSVDDYSGGDAGDSWEQTSEITADSKGVLIIQRATSYEAAEGDVARLEVVRLHEDESKLVAVSTLTCVNVIDNSLSPRQTASVTTTDKFCDDTSGKRCKKSPGIPVFVLKRANGEDSAGKLIDLFEVKTSSGRHGFVPADELLVDCPVPKEEKQ